MCLAVDKQQARIVTRYARGYFDNIALFHGMLASENASEGFTLNNGNEVAILANNLRAVRGRTVPLAVLDEACFYRSDESANPDVDVYNALLPSGATIDDAMIAMISSPHKASGLVHGKWRDHFAKNDDDVLVIQAPSWVMNPTLPQSVIDAAYERDEAAAKAEYGAEWRTDLAALLSRELIDAAVDHGVTVRPPLKGVSYRAFADPAGGTGSDSYTAAVAHKEDQAVILDALVEITPPFSPVQATAEVAAMFRRYGCGGCTGDRYAAGFVVDAFASNGVTYNHSERDRSAIYLEALPLFSSGRVRLLDNKRLANQLAALERRTMPGGKDRIDHPQGGGSNGHHDDAANAACGALSLCGSGVTSLNVSRESARAFGAAMSELGRRQLQGQMARAFGGRASTTYCKW
jgi:hypothetical protein